MVGAVVPYVFFFDFFAPSGVDLAGFVAVAFVNGAAGFTADLLITSVLLWVYRFGRKDGPSLRSFVLIKLLIGLSCAVPACLCVNARSAEGSG
ncbi:MAG: hypothetical protein CMQ49_02700 [Gammaproteobacteria bacterium]|nr:hypothetical protein [Gammaproteobacteria bacterium]|tara:strand:- start:568 stop:846 length:279 start_codon:yes stop_codon:yes gene_type:complete